jgi:hypothetical protein
MDAPKRVADRIRSGMKKLVPVIQQQKDRDVSEADTVTIVKDLLSDVFGYDKYAELTGEFCIRGTYCDLAIKLDGKVAALIEVKAIGIALNERHLKQVVDYAANHGVEWVILTNSVQWQLYNVVFAKPIDKHMLVEFNLLEIDARKDHDVDLLYVMTKEGIGKGAHVALRDKQEATSRYVLAALILEDQDLIKVIRRELRKVVDVLIPEDDIRAVLRDEVIKRDALEGPAAEEAQKRVRRADRQASRPVTTESPIEA